MHAYGSRMRYCISTLPYTMSYQSNAWIAAHTSPRTIDSWLWKIPKQGPLHLLANHYLLVQSFRNQWEEIWQEAEKTCLQRILWKILAK